MAPETDLEESSVLQQVLKPARAFSSNPSPHSPADVLSDASAPSLQELQELQEEQAINPADIRVAAMNFLARREHSLRELQTKLKKRFDDDELINIELQRLIEENLQSDDRYAESYVRQRSGKGYGPVRIRQEMRERGLDDNIVSQAMHCADIDWFAQAEEAYQKKFGMDDAGDLKEKARRIRFMEYRGFTSEHFQHLLEEKRL